MTLPASWTEARKLKARYYFTGRPCKRGHLARRDGANGSCVECNKVTRKPETGHKACAVWRAKNRERDKARKSEWAKKTRTVRSAVTKAYRAKNPEWVRAENQKRKAHRMGAPGSFTADDVVVMQKRQKGRCAHSWCKASIRKAYHVDHIVPLSRGGPNDRKNLQLLCVTCNLKKHAHDPIDFAQRHGALL